MAPVVDVNVRLEGSIALFWCETAYAIAWWAEHVADDDALVFCGAHVVEHRYAADIIRGLVGAGCILKSGAR